MPATRRRAIRTTDPPARLFAEARRRLKIIPDAFGARPVRERMFGAMTRAAERRRPIRFTELGRRRIEAVRRELDAACEAADTPSPAPRHARPVPGSSDSSRT